MPGLCRSAVEAACIDVVWCRRLHGHATHQEIENQNETTTTLLEHLAAALFSDPRRAGDVMNRLNREFGRRAGDVVVALNRGAHDGVDAVSIDALQRDSRWLVDQLEALSTAS